MSIRVNDSEQQSPLVMSGYCLNLRLSLFCIDDNNFIDVLIQHRLLELIQLRYCLYFLGILRHISHDIIVKYGR